MKNILKNKRFMFPIIMCLIVIVIAIIVFIIMGIDTDKERVSEIKLDNVVVNSATNVTNTENSTKEDDEDDENTTKNSTGQDEDEDDEDDGDEEQEEKIDFDGESFYLETAQDFVKALNNKDDMADFIEKHVDAKAYIASYNVKGDDSKFMDEYMSIEVDDEELSALIEKFQEIAVEDKAKLTALTDPRQSGDNEAISRVTLSIKTDDGSKKIRMVFYQNIVIYIYDNNGDSIVDID